MRWRGTGSPSSRSTRCQRNRRRGKHTVRLRYLFENMIKSGNAADFGRANVEKIPFVHQNPRPNSLVVLSKTPERDSLRGMNDSLVNERSQSRSRGGREATAVVTALCFQASCVHSGRQRQTPAPTSSKEWMVSRPPAGHRATLSYFRSVRMSRPTSLWILF